MTVTSNVEPNISTNSCTLHPFSLKKTKEGGQLRTCSVYNLVCEDELFLCVFHFPDLTWFPPRTSKVLSISVSSQLSDDI